MNMPKFRPEGEKMTTLTEMWIYWAWVSRPHFGAERFWNVPFFPFGQPRKPPRSRKWWWFGR